MLAASAAARRRRTPSWHPLRPSGRRGSAVSARRRLDGPVTASRPASWGAVPVAVPFVCPQRPVWARSPAGGPPRRSGAGDRGDAPMLRADGRGHRNVEHRNIGRKRARNRPKRPRAPSNGAFSRTLGPRGLTPCPANGARASRSRAVAHWSLGRAPWRTGNRSRSAPSARDIGSLMLWHTPMFGVQVRVMTSVCPVGLVRVRGRGRTARGRRTCLPSPGSMPARWSSCARPANMSPGSTPTIDVPMTLAAAELRDVNEHPAPRAVAKLREASPCAV